MQQKYELECTSVNRKPMRSLFRLLSEWSHRLGNGIYGTDQKNDGLRVFGGMRTLTIGRRWGNWEDLSWSDTGYWEVKGKASMWMRFHKRGEETCTLNTMLRNGQERIYYCVFTVFLYIQSHAQNLDHQILSIHCHKIVVVQFKTQYKMVQFRWVQNLLCLCIFHHDKIYIAKRN